MEPFKSILVDVDATAAAHPALERGVLLARSIGATLTIVDVVTVPPNARHYLPPDLEGSLLRERRRQLERIALAVTDVRAEAKLLVGRPATALIQEVLRSNHDLLLRSHARDLAAAGPQPFGAVDMELLRKCPCPVLLVRHGRPAVPPQIVAAVDASVEDEDARALNVKIIETSWLISSRLNAAPPRLLQAWAPFAERTLRLHAEDDQIGSYAERARQRAAADLSDLVQSFDGRLTGLQPTLRRVPRYDPAAIVFLHCGIVGAVGNGKCAFQLERESAVDDPPALARNLPFRRVPRVGAECGDQLVHAHAIGHHRHQRTMLSRCRSAAGANEPSPDAA